MRIDFNYIDRHTSFEDSSWLTLEDLDMTFEEWEQGQDHDKKQAIENYYADKSNKISKDIEVLDILESDWL